MKDKGIPKNDPALTQIISVRKQAIGGAPAFASIRALESVLPDPMVASTGGEGEFSFALSIGIAALPQVLLANKRERPNATESTRPIIGGGRLHRATTPVESTHTAVAPI